MVPGAENIYALTASNLDSQSPVQGIKNNQRVP